MRWILVAVSVVSLTGCKILDREAYEKAEIENAEIRNSEIENAKIRNAEIERAAAEERGRQNEEFLIRHREEEKAQEERRLAAIKEGKVWFMNRYERKKYMTEVLRVGMSDWELQTKFMGFNHIDTEAVGPNGRCVMWEFRQEGFDLYFVNGSLNSWVKY